LHHIIENVDFAAAGVRREKLYRFGTDLVTKTLLKAHSVSVLLPNFRSTLIAKYSAHNVLLGTHGTFASIPSPPDYTKRGNPELRILAIGHWGTYKRLETLMEAFPTVLKQVPNARLIIAGANHHTKAGYWESIRDAQPEGLPIEFRGYVPEEAIPELFQSTSILVLPYDSATGSSGPAHQACEYGVPIVCADIDDFHEMATDEDMAIRFYEKGNSDDLAEQFIVILKSPELQRKMAEHNFAAGVEMTITTVVKNYLRWFELHKCKREMRNAGAVPGFRRIWLRVQHAIEAAPEWSLQTALPAQQREVMDDQLGIAPAGNYAHADNTADPFAWSQCEAPKDYSNGDRISANQCPTSTYEAGLE
jgi:glycosyltransferase involved in cell wall biosynthesis